MLIAKFTEFQFQNGAIKSFSKSIVLTSQNWFQFQNGAIKSPIPSVHSQSPVMFQFQNGAIKRFYLQTKWFNLMKFQFQNGAIKSTASALFGCYLLRFNSKMVRLKACNNRC